MIRMEVAQEYQIAGSISTVWAGFCTKVRRSHCRRPVNLRSGLKHTAWGGKPQDRNMEEAEAREAGYSVRI
jgi:hypothetical protein